MPLVNVMVNGRAYTIACDEGEEDHLKALASEVDSKVSELLGSVGQVGDQRLILMAALLLADELHVATAHLETAKQELAAAKAAQVEASDRMEHSESIAADVLENAVKRIEDIAAKLKAA
ncbi:cell division protein ZapA [Rhizomicrobium electricum]|uniref:Cell division protein ZapA n=1 Tax=Rhizomicrobium electricum TaxID=480070 RepID=A0ABP3PXK6_9PROT|nr:cell division protein ZapA [Rhizomicrobium electricum]NIJ49993.1 cell division protein ZapA [Rhizomicrobium electricum]